MLEPGSVQNGAAFLLDEPTAVLMPFAGASSEALRHRLPDRFLFAALAETAASCAHRARALYSRPQGHAPILPEGLCRGTARKLRMPS